MANIHNSSFGQTNDADENQLYQDHPSLLLTIHSPSNLDSNHKGDGFIKRGFSPKTVNVVGTFTQLSSPKTVSPASPKRCDWPLEPIVMNTETGFETAPIMDFGDMEEIANGQSQRRNGSAVKTTAANSPERLNLIEEENQSFEGDESMSATERSLINSLLTKEDGLQFYERNSSYQNSQSSKSQPGSGKSLPQPTIKGALKLDLMVMPEIEEEIGSSSAITSTVQYQEERRSQNLNDKTIDDSKEFFGISGPKLRLNYDRASVYGMEEYTYYYPRNITCQREPRSGTYRLPNQPISHTRGDSSTQLNHQIIENQIRAATEMVRLSRHRSYL